MNSLKISGVTMTGEFVRMAIRAFLEGRSRSARSYVSHRFNQMDDQTLASLGKSRDAIEKGSF